MRILKLPRRSVRSLHRDTASTAALEFALILPILIILFFGMYDTAEGMITYEEVFNATRTIAASMSDVSAQGLNSTTLLYYGQIQQQASAIFAIMPNLRSGFQTGLKSITVSSVNFEVNVTNPACTPGANCDYNAFVVWSVAYQGPGTGPNASLTPTLRNCATSTTTKGVTSLNTTSALTQVAPSTYNPNDLTQLRTLNITSPATSAAAPDPILVVDVHYQYTPLFQIFIHKAIDFYTDAYFPLRSVQATVLNGSTFEYVQSDGQYTGLVAYNSTGSTTAPYTYKITASDVYEISDTGASMAPSASDYCISQYYTEPTSCALATNACTAS